MGAKYAGETEVLIKQLDNFEMLCYYCGLRLENTNVNNQCLKNGDSTEF